MRTKCERGDSVYAGLIEVSPALRALSFPPKSGTMPQRQVRRLLPMCVQVSTYPLTLSCRTRRLSERARRNRRALFFLQFPYSLTYWLT